ncbi:MAG: aminoglycoside phosphotransferase family protein [Gammaproteobacteria bacterium]
MDARAQALQQWLTKECKLPAFTMHTLPGDASFRRYFRINISDTSYIAMDAPPPGENCLPFIAIAQTLRGLNLSAPEIVASDVTQGFLLITDFGDRVLLKELNDSNANVLYGKAIDALAILQSCRTVHNWEVPVFTQEFMRRELLLFKEWFLERHLKLTLTKTTENQLAACFDFLAQNAANQTQVFMHRDYHSANLMVLPEAIGILDFQDAFMGPVTYDLVSLLRDCYIAWPDTLVNQLVLQYWERLNLPAVSSDEFLRWFDLMGLQRHMKALLTFSRKLHRDGNANYLQHIPRTLEYIQKVSARYPECSALHEFITNQVLLCVE